LRLRFVFPSGKPSAENGLSNKSGNYTIKTLTKQTQGIIEDNYRFEKFNVKNPGVSLFRRALGRHADFVILNQLAGGLVPSSCPIAEPVITVAVGAILVLGGRTVKKGLMLLCVYILLRMAGHAGRVYLFKRIHSIGWCNIVFVTAMGVRGPVALLTADVGPGVQDRQLLVLIIHVADVAPAVVSHGPLRRRKLLRRRFVQQQKRLFIGLYSQLWRRWRSTLIAGRFLPLVLLLTTK
jgi:hypothetical protein